jgi:hypothetical protein
MSKGRVHGYEGVPELHRDAVEHRRMLARAVNRLTAGKLNGALEVRLRPGETSTEVLDPRLAPGSVLLWMPRSASASAAEREGIWVSFRSKGVAVLNHAPAAAPDQDLTLLIIG